MEPLHLLTVTQLAYLLTFGRPMTVGRRRVFIVPSKADHT
jgi:hypothetical protein